MIDSKMQGPTRDVLEVVAAELERLVHDAKNDAIRTKLRNLNDVCYHLVIVGRQRLTVPDLVAAYAARIHASHQSIAESSIRNKRGGINPFQKLYRVWESASNTIRSSNLRHVRPGSADQILSYEDVAHIPDAALKHQISLIIRQNRGYKSELDMLKQVRGAPVVKLPDTIGDHGSRLVADHLTLNEAEIEAVKDFMSIHKLKSRSLRHTADGGLETIDGRRIADPGFMDALQKVVKSYQTPG